MTARIQRYGSSIAGVGLLVALYGLLWTLMRGRLEWLGGACLAAGLLALAGGIALQPRQIWRALTGRIVREGSNALAVTVAVLGILALLNILGARYHRRVDLTAERQFSLSQQTLQVLAALPEPVTITAFMTPRYYARQQVEDLLKEYSYRSSLLRYEIIDPEKQPGKARQAGVTRDGTIIFQAGERRQEALGSDEQEFTSALVKVTRKEQKKVYFLTGHKERDPEDYAPEGYRQIAQALQRDNYQVAPLNLVVSPTVPSDAAAVIIAAPIVTPTVAEFQALNTYVDGGGSLCILGDPASSVNLDPLLARWGLSLRSDVIIDPVSSPQGDPATPVASRYPYHDITKDLGGLMTLYPVAASIGEATQPPEGVTLSPLVQTSAQSWGETDRNNQQVRLDAGQDTSGPLHLGVAATLALAQTSETGEAKHARLVVFGDADWVSNDVLQSLQGYLGNADLFLNAISWLAEEETLISIRPSRPAERIVMLTAPQVQLVLYASIILLPGAVAVAGFWVWWKRR
ncbi:MAG: GldG family protein [Anaerolineae bacterium]